MDDLKIGFIGAGGFARHTLYPALHLAPVALQAICDADQDRAKRAAGKFGTGRVYSDWREMCVKEDIEALIISMGPAARQSLVIQAMHAGYHVLTPKPPAESLAATKELSAVARETGKTLMVNFQRRFSLGSREAKRLMATDSFGKPSSLFFSFCSGKYPDAQTYLLDFAIHHFDLCRHLGGDIAEIAVFHNEINGQGAFALSMQYTSGAVGTMQLTSQRLWSRNYDHIEITGEGEYVVLDGLWGIQHFTQSGNSFISNSSDERNGELTGDGYSLTEWVTSIRENRQPVCNIHDCVKTMELYEAVLSGKKGVIKL
ncbi:MAG: Gfo/Idh/MocA family oxidoreductase [Candidatus Poribacteria bacterium]|nr:Gfo/Idh/MocA family oxidoreductase [Candidatus Poribacteria bacterium]